MSSGTHRLQLDEATPISPEPGKLTAHDRRLVQLSADGLIDFYRPGKTYKTILHRPEVIAPPKPLLGSIGCKREFIAKHEGVAGPLPGSGFYRIPNCFVGKCGTILDAERKVIWGDDLVSSYWMWFLGKMIHREAVVGNAPKPSIIGSFIAGGAQHAVRAIEGDTPVVCLTKPGIRVYGHWILDTLPLLWNFEQAQRSGAIRGPFRYLLSASTPGWALSLIELLFGIDQKQLVFHDDDKETVAVRDLVVPGLLRIGPLLSLRMNDFVAEVISTVRRKFPTSFERRDLPEDLFISRSDFASDTNRSLVNHEDVARAVAEAGLALVMPEKMPWPDQLAMFSRARVIAGEYGSGLHNAMFASPEAVSLVFASLKMNWTQSGITGLRGQRAIYVQPRRQTRTGRANGLSYEIAPESIGEAAAMARGRHG